MRSGIAALHNKRMQLTRGGLEASGSTMVGPAIVNHGKIVRPSQLIRSVGRTPSRTSRKEEDIDGHTNDAP